MKCLERPIHGDKGHSNAEAITYLISTVEEVRDGLAEYATNSALSQAVDYFNHEIEGIASSNVNSENVSGIIREVVSEYIRDGEYSSILSGIDSLNNEIDG